MGESGGSDSKLITIVVVNWNTRELLKECLNSVRHHAPLAETEVIVVDNHSHDGSAEMVRQDFPWCRLIANSENVGFGRANNQAARVARGRYVMLLNSDAKMLDDGLCDVLEYMETHQDVGVATGKILASDHSFRPPYERFPNLLGVFFDQTVLRVLPPIGLYDYWKQYGGRDRERAQDVDWVSGAYQVVRAEICAGQPLFDEEIFMYYEDALLCYRVRKQGYRVVYLPLAPVVHSVGASGKKVRARIVWNSFQGSIVYIRRRYGERVGRGYAAAVRGVWWGFAALLAVPAAFGVDVARRKREFFSVLVKGDFQA